MIRSQARLAEEQPHFPMRQGARIVRRKAGSPAHGHAPIHRPQVRRRRAASVMPRSRHRSRMAMQLVAPMLLFLTLVFQLWVRVGILESGYMLESRRQEAVNKDAEVRRLMDIIQRIENESSA